MKKTNKNLKVEYVETTLLSGAEYNPRRWNQQSINNLKESIEKFGMVDPIMVNSAQNRKNIVIGGHFRLFIARQLGYETVPVVYVNIPEIEKEKELNLRLNKNTGDWDFKLLAEFDTSLLADIGFSSEDLDDIFGLDDTPEEFDLEKELKKLNIHKINIKKGDVYRLGDSKLMCGDSTETSDVLKLFGNEKADMCFTEPPYILDYLKGKKKAGEAVTGFGAKRDRRYLETDSLPEDFTEKWMANIAKVQKKLSFYTENKTKTKWGSKTFDFKDIFKCAYCGASVVGEEKFKLLKSGKKNRHVYYHCSKKIDPNCPEPYVNEIDLIDRFIRFVELLETRKNTAIEISKVVKLKMTKYKSVRDQILEQQKVSIEDKPLRFSEFFKHIVMNGTNAEKQEILACIKQLLYIHNAEIFSNQLI